MEEVEILEKEVMKAGLGWLASKAEMDAEDCQDLPVALVKLV